MPSVELSLYLPTFKDQESVSQNRLLSALSSGYFFKHVKTLKYVFQLFYETSRKLCIEFT